MLQIGVKIVGKLIKILLIINDKLKTYQIEQALKIKNISLKIYFSFYELLYYEDDFDYDLLIWDKNTINLDEQALKLFSMKGSKLFVPSILTIDKETNLFENRITYEDLLCKTNEIVEQIKKQLALNSIKLVDIRKKIAILMKESNISPKLSGFDFIQEAIILIMRNKSYSLSKDIYPNLSNKFNTTSSRIEKDIRYAIKKSNLKDSNVTNKSFILEMVEKIKYI